MKKEDISDALNEVDEKLLQSTEKRRMKRPKRNRKVRIMALCAAVAILVVGVFTLPMMKGIRSPDGETPFISAPSVAEKGPRATALAHAVIPERILNPNDYAGREARWARITASVEAGDIYAYTRTALPVLMEGAEGENRAISPLNIYLALAMLAESTEGASREELLAILGEADAETLREKVNAIWDANYEDDGIVKSLLASSLWLRDDMTYREETIQTLAEKHHASVFSGVMGSKNLDEALRDWVNENTGGLLKEAAEGLEFNDDTLLGLVTTVYFKAGWMDDCSFNKEHNRELPFHALSGDENCTFMENILDRTLYQDEGFRAVRQALADDYSMWLILPDEGVEAESLWKNEGIYDLILSTKPKGKDAHVTLRLPKFDVSTDTDLIESLEKLGVESVFGEGTANFSPLLGEGVQAYVSEITHAARVKADEEGVEAAAFTTIAAEAECEPPKLPDVELVFDRPFLFAITAPDGSLLFAGTVNHPEG